MNVVIRGDVNTIRIGDRTNIQDGTVIHVMRGTHPTRDRPRGDGRACGDAARLHDPRSRADRHGRDAAERRRDWRGLDRCGGHAGAGGEEVSRPLAADGAAGGAQARADRRRKSRASATTRERYIGYRKDYMPRTNDVDAARARHARFSAGRRAPPRVRRRHHPRASTIATGSSRSRRRPPRTSRHCSASTARKATSSSSRFSSAASTRPAARPISRCATT